METYRQWQCPVAEASEGQKLGWLTESTQEGQNWQKSQRGYKDWVKGLDILSGGSENDVNIPPYRSRISGHRLKTNIKVMAAGLSNIKPMWGFHGTQRLASHLTIMNRTSRAIFLEGRWDQAFRDVIAYSLATGLGWAHPVYRRAQMGRGKGSICIDAFGAPCVLPNQLPSNGDWQEAYIVHLMDEMPIYMAHAQWPDFQDRIHPTTSKYWYSSNIRDSAERNVSHNPLRARHASDPKSEVYVPIRWSTVLDLRINDTSTPLHMGQPGSRWEYTVPFMGQEIPDGFGGIRRADENDCRVYPQRRLIISTENCVMYDGPGFNWHGQLDLVPFSIDSWPWEPMGFSTVHDGWELQEAIDSIDRGVMDKVSALNKISMAYDINSINPSEAQSYDPYMPNGRVPWDSSQSETPFKLPVPIEVYHVQPEVMSFREKLNEELDYQSQSRDIMELGKARALGKGMDQLEALISANGPLVKDISRRLEVSFCKVGEQVGWLIPEWLTVPRLLQYADPDTLGMEIFDFHPESLIPSHLPHEQVYDEMENPIPSKSTEMERAKWFCGNVHFIVMPHSIHEITQMTHRLMLMQLKQRGAPISWATTMESCEVNDVKRPEGNFEQDRYWAEKEEELVQMSRMKQVMEGMGLDPSAMGGGGKGSSPQGGRPQSFKSPPAQKMKGDGRPVTSTSEG